MSGLEDDEFHYETGDVAEYGFEDGFKEDHVYIAFGLAEDTNKAAINIIDLTKKDSELEQVFLPIAHSFIDYVLNNTTEAQQMGMRLITELDGDATEH